MGKNNRARRAAKAKRRSHEHRSHEQRPRGYRREQPEPLLTTRELVAGLLGLAATPPRGDDTLAASATERLCRLDRHVVCDESERDALRMTESVWNGGWQPTELVRQVTRMATPATARLSIIAIAADHARRRSATLDPRWVEQLDRLDIPRLESPGNWLADWSEREQTSWAEVVDTVVALLRCLASLTPIPTLIAPPGTRATDAPIDLTSGTSDAVLDRVRALLAQAESTSFEAEAEAFTAKAQELITRHAIDVAMLSASTGRSETLVTIRIPIDDPYVDAKSLLLQCVAEHSRCRSVFHSSYAMSSVMGFPADVAATETLFTSLLVQAQTALQAAAVTAPAGARTRSRSFRSAFLVAYAGRIAERLAAVNAGVISDAEAETSRSILPVLAARSSSVDEGVEAMFGDLGTTTVRGGYDSAGWASGHLAADRAQLTFGDITDGQTAGNPQTDPSSISLPTPG